jgi:hypothetical protein
MKPVQWNCLRQDLRQLTADQCRLAMEVIIGRLQQLENQDPLLDSDLNEQGLSKRAYGALVHSGLMTPRQVIEYGVDRLEMLRGAGTKTVQEIRTAMDRILQNDQSMKQPLITYPRD